MLSPELYLFRGGAVDSESCSEEVKEFHMSNCWHILHFCVLGEMG